MFNCSFFGLRSSCFKVPTDEEEGRGRTEDEETIKKPNGHVANNSTNPVTTYNGPSPELFLNQRLAKNGGGGYYYCPRCQKVPAYSSSSSREVPSRGKIGHVPLPLECLLLESAHRFLTCRAQSKWQNVAEMCSQEFR